MSFEIPEPEEWELYVKKGDLHPQTPVWANERKERIQYNAQIENIKTPDHSLRRQARKMDFIARGKSEIK